MISTRLLQEFLAGTPSDGIQRQGNTNRNTFENSHAAYVQDSFHWKKNVTINLGLRYDYFGIVQEKHGNFTNIDTTTGFGFVLGQSRLYQPDYNNWGPRVSVAWDLTGKGKTVLRAGYGIFYDGLSQDMFMGHSAVQQRLRSRPGVLRVRSQSHFFCWRQLRDRLTPTLPVFGFASTISDAFGVDQHLRTPYMQNFNLNLQQELSRRTVLQIGYVGSNGHKLAALPRHQPAHRKPKSPPPI